MNNQISDYSLKEGSLNLRKTFDIDEDSELKYFIKTDYLFLFHISYNQRNQLDTATSYVYSYPDKVITLDKNLAILEILESDIFFYLKPTTEQYSLSRTNGKIVIVSQENKIVVELMLSRNAILIKEKIYDLQDKSLIEIDISELP
ncbi:MAG: hypothetical protein LBU51_00670 [Bacteroidales bacterium]|nr:hypothetical protein [Bacteroidales bacterium]